MSRGNIGLNGILAGARVQEAQGNPLRPLRSVLKPAHSLVSVALAAVLLASPSVREVAAQPPAAPDDGAYRGYVAVRLLDDGDYEIIDELNAERFFVPASVLKVVTVATALEYLGADYRWLTRVTSRGAVTDGVLEGDLVIEAWR